MSVNNKLFICISFVIILSFISHSPASETKLMSEATVKGGGYLYVHTNAPTAEDAINGNGNQSYNRKLVSNEDEMSFKSTYASFDDLDCNNCPSNSHYSNLSDKGVLNLSWRREYGNKCNEYFAKFDDKGVMHTLDMRSYGKMGATVEMMSQGNIAQTNFKFNGKGNLSERVIDNEGEVPKYLAETELRGELTYNSKIEKQIERELDLIYKLEGVEIKTESGRSRVKAYTGTGMSLESQSTEYSNIAVGIWNSIPKDQKDHSIYYNNMLDNLSVAVELNKNNDKAWLLTGLALQRLNRSQEAVQAFDTAYTT